MVTGDDNKIIPCIPLGSEAWAKKKNIQLTNDTLVSSWQSLPAWTAVWVEARSAHIGPVETRQKEQTHSLVSWTPQMCFSETPKQIHKLTRCSQGRPKTCVAACFQNKQNQFWYKTLSSDGWWYFRREEGNARWGSANMRNRILFSLKAECKLGRAGCIKVLFSPEFHTRLFCPLEDIQISCAAQPGCTSPFYPPHSKSA